MPNGSTRALLMVFGLLPNRGCAAHAHTTKPAVPLVPQRYSRSAGVELSTEGTRLLDTTTGRGHDMPVGLAPLPAVYRVAGHADHS
ncbi:MAG: hypothetical protein ACRDRG_15205 [Pseudonocardiaceae bacterium]